MAWNWRKWIYRERPMGSLEHNKRLARVVDAIKSGAEWRIAAALDNAPRTGGGKGRPSGKVRTALAAAVPLAFVLVVTLTCLPGLGGSVRHDEGGRGGMAARGFAGRAPAGRAMGTSRRPVVINMGHQGSGWGNGNFPRGTVSGAARPAWGQSGRPAASAGSGRGFRTGTRVFRGAGLRLAAVHHHLYTSGYVRGRLRKAGVRAEPGYITDRAEMIHSNRAHSVIAYPSRGPDGRALGEGLITPRGAGASGMSARMAQVSGAGWRSNVERWNRSDTRVGHYYWHQGGGFDTCHYLDAYGYQWYGWYGGGQYFWARNFSGRWWWYDGDFGRWTFYADGFWWWQDPYHIGDLYCYDDGSYVPVNSGDDEVAVAPPDMVDFQSYNSDDGSRTVKVVEGSDDAFLYDNTPDGAFQPLYLASGVQRVEFSGQNNGRPLEIVLKLSDDSYDLFDGEGRTYNPDADAGAAASEAAP